MLTDKVHLYRRMMLLEAYDYVRRKDGSTDRPEKQG